MIGIRVFNRIFFFFSLFICSQSQSGNGENFEKAKITIDEKGNSTGDYNSPIAAIRNRIERMDSEHGAHQCIEELSSQMSQQNIQTPQVTIETEMNDNKSTPPSSFVTVIEVKETAPVNASASTLTECPEEPPTTPKILSKETKSFKCDDSPSAGQNVDVKRKIPPR